MPIIGTTGRQVIADPAPRAMDTLARQPADDRSPMQDILMLAIGCACFAVAILYARACGSF